MTALRSTTLVRLSILQQLGLLGVYSGVVFCSGLTACGEVDQSSQYAEVPYRTEASVCVNKPVDDASIKDSGVTGACQTAADCTEKEHGYCKIAGGQLYETVCAYGCETDADCGAGAACDCGENVGVCLAAECHTNADCGGAGCMRFVQQDPCTDGFGPTTSFRCESPADTCRSDQDCEGETACLRGDGGVLSCQERSLCGIGRPFLVEKEHRLAQVVERKDWTCELADEFARLADSLSAEERQELAAGYREIALMEHASIAAFARFSLQLLALAAPAHLIEATNRALVDETRHARLSFALSGVFSEMTEGPGALSMQGAFQEIDLHEVTELVLLEGCIGETAAALGAKWASEKCLHRSLSELLATIADDEQQHSHLAWEFVSWATEQKNGLADSLLARAERELEKPSAPRSFDAANDTWKAKYGLVPEKVREELRREVLAEVVIPCLSALCAKRAA